MDLQLIHMRKKTVYIITASLILALLLFIAAPGISLITSLHWKIYDRLLSLETSLKPPPALINDILIVGIDNRTIKNMPQRWPYPRSDFAKVIQNLKKAQAKIIAFDFVFLGKSTAEEDSFLEAELLDKNKVILATAIDENGEIELQTNSALGDNISSGIITKLREKDGVTRKNLTYLVRDKKTNEGFLSWEMQILKNAKNIDLASLEADESLLSFKNYDNEKWTIPVDRQTKSFLIHFRAHTTEFKKLSFYDVLNKNFNPDLIKNKIVLIGMLSSLFQDLHLTPIGWLPGVTLNANAFLALYNHDFLKSIPRLIELLVLIIGVFISGCLISLLKIKKFLILTTVEILFFFVLSFILLAYGYTWNYSLFPLAALLCPILAKKLTMNTGRSS